MIKICLLFIFTHENIIFSKINIIYKKKKNSSELFVLSYYLIKSLELNTGCKYLSVFMNIHRVNLDRT